MYRDETKNFSRNTTVVITNKVVLDTSAPLAAQLDVDAGAVKNNSYIHDSIIIYIYSLATTTVNFPLLVIRNLPKFYNITTGSVTIGLTGLINYEFFQDTKFLGNIVRNTELIIGSNDPSYGGLISFGFTDPVEPSFTFNEVSITALFFRMD